MNLVLFLALVKLRAQAWAAAVRGQGEAIRTIFLHADVPDLSFLSLTL